MLRKLRAAIQPPAPAGSGSPAGQPTAAMLSGGLQVGVVGESHYQDALTAIVGGKRPEASASRPKPPSCPSRTTPMTQRRRRLHRCPEGRAPSATGRPAFARWAGDSPNNNRSAPVRRPSPGWDRGDGDTGHFGVTLDLAHPNPAVEPDRRREARWPCHRPGPVAAGGPRKPRRDRGGRLMPAMIRASHRLGAVGRPGFAVVGDHAEAPHDLITGARRRSALRGSGTIGR